MITSNEFDDDYPCNDCEWECDGWESMFCCTLCHYNGCEDCDNCDPWDI
jgi:hypothetical protein